MRGRGRHHETLWDHKDKRGGTQGSVVCVETMQVKTKAQIDAEEHDGSPGTYATAVIQ